MQRQDSKLIIKSLIYISCLCLLSSCAKQNLSHNNLFKSDASSSSSYVLISEEIRARLYDIPLPINKDIWILCDQKDSRKQILKYLAQGTLEDLFIYYKTEMEYLGWQELTITQADDSCMVFVKPGKTCTIVISQTNTQNSYKISVFIGPKKTNK